MQMFGVVIVGGGPAGLSAALLLGRVPSRKVLLVDRNQSRNGPSHAMHGSLSRDGLPAGELRRIGREQLVLYEKVTVLNAAVQSGQAIQGGFRLQMSGGAVIEAKKVIVATGVVDHSSVRLCLAMNCPGTTLIFVPAVSSISAKITWRRKFGPLECTSLRSTDHMPARISSEALRRLEVFKLVKNMLKISR